MELLKCYKCDKEFSKDEVKKEKVGVHLKAICPLCGSYIKFLEQTEPSGDDILPFGKYKDKSVDWICTNDNEYALWASDNLKGRYKRAFKKCLNI